MTTPNQPLPATLETLLGVGAFQIGGGGTTFGQDIDEDFVNNLVKLPYATLDNMIDILQLALLRLPIEALQAFSSLIPDWLEDSITDVASAVSQIIDALQARDLPLALSVFEDFVEHMLNSLGIPVLGDLVDKIFDLTDGFDSFFSGFNILDGSLIEQFVNAITGVLGGDFTDLTSWAGNVPGLAELVEALTGVVGGDFTDITAWVADIPVIGDIIAMIVEAITGIVGGDTTDLTTWSASVPVLGDLIEAITGAAGGDYTDLTDFFTHLLDDVPVLGDIVAAITGTSGDITDLDSFFTDLLGIFGTPTGLGTGTPTIPGLSSIPILGPLFDLFGGATTSTQADNFFTNLLSLLNNPSLTTTPGSFNINTAASNFVNNVLSPTGLLAALADILPLFGGATTGTQADNFMTNLLSIFDSPTGLTGTPGSFDPVTAGVNIISDLVPDLTSGFASIFDQWFGGSTAAGTPAEVATTVAAIRTAVTGGYTLQTFTSSNSSWSVPAGLADATESYAICVGGGGKGMPGIGNPPANATGGVGGVSGGYSSEKFDASTLGSTLNITIGAAASTNGASGGSTSIKNGATFLSHSVANVGSLSSPQGYIPSNSEPGQGGQGGGAISTVTASLSNGVAGESNAFATGGTLGAGSIGAGSGTGNAGGAGGAGQTSTIPLAGGAGGGGGGGRVSTTGTGTITGGAGGAGGFPGGGSGGGGNSSGGTTENGGAAGTPGNGFAALLWK